MALRLEPRPVGPNAPVPIAARKNPRCPGTSRDDSATPTVNGCYRRIFSLPSDDVGELLRTATGRELNRGLETLPDLNGRVSRGESCTEFESTHLAESETVAPGSEHGDCCDEGSR